MAIDAERYHVLSRPALETLREMGVVPPGGTLADAVYTNDFGVEQESEEVESEEVAAFALMIRARPDLVGVMLAKEKVE